MARWFNEYQARQKEIEDIQIKMDETLTDVRAQDISYRLLLCYGVKIDKEAVKKILKARKAK